MPKAKQPKPSKTLAEQYTELNKKYLITKKALKFASISYKGLYCSNVCWCQECETCAFKDIEKYFMARAKKELENAN